MDKRYVERKLEVMKTVFEQNKEMAAGVAGPAVMEIFGETPFSPEAKETAKAVPLKEEALPEPPAETEPPTEIMLRMTEEAADTARAAPGNEGMQEREADPAMQIRRIMKTMIVLMSRKTGTAMKILKNCSRKDAGWILKIWRILMSRKNMEITGMTRI